MKKIILFCSAGMSTSLLVESMRKAAEEKNYECEIDAYPISTFNDHRNIDCVLLGPQVRFQLKKVKSFFTCPVESIDMMDYGTMNGKKVLEFAQTLMQYQK